MIPPEEPVARRRRLTADTTPLREAPDFRRLWIGQLVSILGSEVTQVALAFQVYDLTRSPLAVGALGLCAIAPLLLLSLVGGAIADALDRRRVAMWSEAALLVASLGLAANAALPTPKLWVLYLAATVVASLDGLGRPALAALVPRLVEPRLLPAASALEGLSGSVAFVAGPALAGGLLAFAGATGAYLVDVATFGVSLVFLARMAPVPPAPDADRVSLRAIRDGFRFLRGQPVIIGTYVLDFNAMIFGMPAALFPAIALDHFGGGPGLVGLLFAAPAAGMLVASTFSGWTGRVHRHGRAIALAVAVWGGAIVAFGFAPSAPLALLALAVAGAADMVSGVFRMTVWNTLIPDEMRGRLAGVSMANYSGGPVLGDLEAGVVASLTSVRVSVVSGGLMCMAGVAVIAALMPALWDYDARRSAYAGASRAPGGGAL